MLLTDPAIVVFRTPESASVSEIRVEPVLVMPSAIVRRLCTSVLCSCSFKLVSPSESCFAPAKISFSSFPSSAAFSVAIALFTSVRPSARG